MAYLRIFYATSAGIGLFCGSCINKLGENTFKVNAQKRDLERKPGSEHYQNPHLGSRFAKYGLPQRDATLRYRHFQMSYDQKHLMPNWTLEHLNLNLLNDEDDSGFSKSNFHYHWEPKVKKEFQSDNIDFVADGLERATMADFNNYVNAASGIIDTHARTNAVPQIREFSMGVWVDLERYCRYLTEVYDDVYVFSGPVFEPTRQDRMLYQLSQTNHLAYPTHYYKIIIGKTRDNFHLGCYLIPHRRIGPNLELRDFRVELSVVENKVGFKLFKDGVNIPETLANICDFRERLLFYLPDEDLVPNLIDFPPDNEMPIGAGVDQNGHNGHEAPN